LSKVTLQRISTFQNDVSAPAAFNANMTLLEAIIDTLLSRDGTSPNQVTADLDMNSKRVLNLPSPVSGSEPVRLTDLEAVVLASTNGTIVPGSVNEAALASSAVTTGKIADSAVTSAKIADGTIAAGDLASDSVTTAKILNNNVTLTKLAQISTARVLGNVSGSTGNVSEVTMADLLTALGVSTVVPTGSIVPFGSSRVGAGFLPCNGAAVSRTTYSTLYVWMCPSSTVTFSGDDVQWTGHPIAEWDRVVFSTTGSLPTGITAGTTYYARDIAADTFKIAATAGDAAISLSGSPTGTNTCQAVGFGLGDGSTTFNVPDLRGEFIRGHDLGRDVDTDRSLGSAQSHQVQDHVHTTGYTSTTTLNGSFAVTVATPASPGTNTSNPTSGNHGTETRPRNISLAFGIKT
jgi:hypothetical protein